MAGNWKKYEDDPDRRWYGQQVWKNIRAAHLALNPLCVFCLAKDVMTPATVVDHIKPWRKAATTALRRALFLDPLNHQSLCKHCHDSTKQIIERGRKPKIGLDGYPVEDGDEDAAKSNVKPQAPHPA